MISVDYNEYKETIAENMELIQENHKLQEIIDKSIEYLDNLRYTFSPEELKQILKGEDKE